MFNKRKITEIEAEIKDLRQELEQFVSCKGCSCIGKKSDFKEVTYKMEETSFSIWSCNSGTSYEYFCKRCTPEYDYVYVQSKGFKYYKTVFEHREEVKIKK